MKLNRREFIKNSALTAMGVAFISSNLSANEHLAHTTHMADSASKGKVKFTPSGTKRAVIYFSSNDGFDTLSAACERIYPRDDEFNTPGAIELGVPYFIDRQLASDWGNHTREYMMGPFFEGVPEQGYQSPVKRNEVIKLGLQGLDDKANELYQKRFVELEPTKQDEILSLAESSKIELGAIKSSYFFSLLRQITLAGVYADPTYGGNDNKNAWRVIEYPGPVMSYLADITSKEFYRAEPISLADMSH
ncbi:MAG: gluconate 2-dehydrogenase subunit 3 family protein [Campylobacter sp.]|nr:gluconate 2-dehydrogenase subunit 3 family protein [Campylobacter sp.]